MFYIKNKPTVSLIRNLLLLVMISSFVPNIIAQNPVSKEDQMVSEFYEINGQQLHWFSANKNIKNAAQWLTMLGSADDFGIVVNKLQISKLQTDIENHRALDVNARVETDKQITGLVLNFLKALQEGNVTFEYDEVSVPRDSVYIFQLLSSKPRGSVSKLVSQLECKDHDYVVLKKYLHDSINSGDTFKYKTVVLALNYLRYLSVYHQTEYIIANIPATEVEYYKDEMLVLKMRSVVGKKANPTPVMASYISSIVTFPHWNVPYTVAVNEILPKVQKDADYLEQHNFEVVDAKGNAVDDSELNWLDYSEKNFPYFFRQSTGADNALGVLKFNLQNPFSIFLHSTSWQGAFDKDFRFLSHGCIRLEKPFDLADALLRGNLDVDELKRGKENTESKTIKLPQKVPTFIIYVPVKVNGAQVIFLQDVYKLIK